MMEINDANRALAGGMRGEKHLCYTAMHSTKKSGKGLHRDALIGRGVLSCNSDDGAPAASKVMLGESKRFPARKAGRRGRGGKGCEG